MSELQETLKVEKISPTKAKTYLNHNNSNRALREGVVEQYASDMKSGKWTHCVAPIVFYENGDIADGQHRLWAIIESGVSQDFFVMRNLPRDAGLNIDIGLNRNLVDNARIAGLDSDLTYTVLGAARACALGRRSRNRMSPAKQLEMLEPIREHVFWAVHHGPRTKYLSNALMYAAIARAHMHETDEERLAHFCRVMHTGMPNGPEDVVAISLRNHLIKQGPSGSSTEDMWLDNFLRVQNSIWNFMRGVQISRIRAVGKETYPLPKPRKPLKPGKKG